MPFAIQCLFSDSMPAVWNVFSSRTIRVFVWFNVSTSIVSVCFRELKQKSTFTLPWHPRIYSSLFVAHERARAKHQIPTSTTCNLDRNILVLLSIKHTVLRAQKELFVKNHRKVSGKGMLRALQIWRANSVWQKSYQQSAIEVFISRTRYKVAVQTHGIPVCIPS